VRPMNSASRVGLFGLGLVAVFGGAFAMGAGLDPDAGDGANTHGEGVAAHADRAQVSRGPARLVVEDRSFEPGVGGTLAFRVVDRDGRTVRDFDVEHERAMHVIAARHDLTGYQHLHPRRTRDGGWAVDVAFPESGPHRVYADFVTAGKPHTLAADVEVAGTYDPRPLRNPARTASAGDGYAVAVSAAGAERRYTVTRDGEPVDDIEPYLGARGHLVALRAGDLAFQHVHPKDAATEGREINFDVALEGAGDHRLFLQFKHDGEVRTAAFTERGADRRAAHGEDDHGH
jgi:hypothetical protein